MQKPLILSYKDKKPSINPSCFIAQNAVISGDVEIGEGSAIWYFCILRGDVSSIKIGKNTNIQDGTTIHVTRPNHLANKTGAEGGKAIIGNNVTVGHNCIIHASTLRDNCFVGMGSILMDLSVMEEGSMLAAGSVLTPKTIVKSGELWGGVPARKMRDLKPEEVAYIQTSADNYYTLAMEYKNECKEVE